MNAPSPETWLITKEQLAEIIANHRQGENYVFFGKKTSPLKINGLIMVSTFASGRSPAKRLLLEIISIHPIRGGTFGNVEMRVDNFL